MSHRSTPAPATPVPATPPPATPAPATPARDATDAADAHEVLSLERRALERWCRGDPSGFLELSAADVVYFDPLVDRRIDGLSALSRYYEPLRGAISADRWEIITPLVQVAGSIAVLTFQFASWGGSDNALRWNCTEVYRRDPSGWRIIQTHWSIVRAGVRPPPSATAGTG